MNMESKKIVKSHVGDANQEKAKKFNSEIKEIKKPKSNVNAKSQFSQINTVHKNEGGLNSPFKAKCREFGV